MKTITLRELNRATLARQMLLARTDEDVVAAVARLAGMQAQLARPPFVGLWTRLAGFARADLAKALHARKLVRATMMRATLHLVTAADYLAMRGGLQAALSKAMKSALRDRADTLDLPALERAARKFFDEKARTFDELRAHLGRAGGDERAMAYAVRTMLPLVQVPTGDTWAFPAAADLAVAETWLEKKIPVGDAREVVRRYLAAFGPATPGDAQAWSGLPSLKETFAKMRAELIELTDDRGRVLYDLEDAPRPPGEVTAPPRFLPDFDNLVLEHDDRRRVIDDAHRPLIVTKNLLVKATFLVDGVVAGTWKIDRKGKTARLQMSALAKIGKADKAALVDEAERLVRFSDEDAAKHEVSFDAA